MNPQILTLLVAVATILGVGMTVPQVVQIQRTRDFDGVSGVWVGVGLAMNAWWVLYGLHADLWSLIPVSAGAILLYAAMAVQAVVFVGPSALRQLGAGLFGLGAVPLLVLIGFGWEATGYTIGLFYSVQFSPAVIAAYRTKTPTGISPMTWFMALIEAMVWAVYAADRGDGALFVGGTGGTVMSVLILARLLWLSQAKVRPQTRRLARS